MRRLVGLALNGLAAALLYLSATVLAVLAGVMLPFFVTSLVLHLVARWLLYAPPILGKL